MHTELLSNGLGTAWLWSLVLLVANGLGSIVYLIAASPSWVIPQERSLHSVTGEPFVWALYVFPIGGFFFIINLIWGAFIAARRRWLDARLWLFAIFIWCAAILIDFAHH